MIMDTADLRQYLSFPPRGSAVEVMRDAVETQVLGAVWLLELVLSVRVNRRVNRLPQDAPSTARRSGRLRVAPTSTLVRCATDATLESIPPSPHSRSFH